MVIYTFDITATMDYSRAILLSEDKFLDIFGSKIICRCTDGYINLTDMVHIRNKKLSHWKSSAKEFLKKLSELMDIPIEDGTNKSLIKYTDMGKTNRATWGHPLVAINVAKYLSPEIEVRTTVWIYELMMRGTVTRGQEMPLADIDELFINKIQKLKRDFDNVNNAYCNASYANERIQIAYRDIYAENYRMMDELNRFKSECIEWREKFGVEFREIGYASNEYIILYKLSSDDEFTGEDYYFHICKANRYEDAHDFVTSLLRVRIEEVYKHYFCVSVFPRDSAVKTLNDLFTYLSDNKNIYIDGFNVKKSKDIREFDLYSNIEELSLKYKDMDPEWHLRKI